MARKTFALVLAVSLLICSAFGEGQPDMVSIGDSYLAAGDMQRALAAYDIAVNIDADGTEALLHMAAAHEIGGNRQAALSCLDEAIARDPLCGQAYQMRMELRTASSAEDAWQDALRAELCGYVPDSKQYAELGKALYESGCQTEAVEAFRLAGDLALSDEYASVFRYALIRTGNNDDVAALGLTSRPDARLSALFERGNLHLIELAAMDRQTEYTFVFPASYAASEAEAIFPGAVRTDDGNYALTMDKTLVDSFLDETFLLSVSPDGNTLVFSNGLDLYVIEGGVLKPFVYAAERGVEDVYGNVEKAIRLLARAGSADGAAWSPDGRFFVLTSMRQTLINVQWAIDLLIFDTDAGEYYLGATYASKMQEENAGSVFQACFDETGQSIFYILYGRSYENRVALMEYSLANETIALCYNGPEFAAYPRLCLDPFGCYVNIQDHLRTDTVNALNVYSPGKDDWINQPAYSAVPLTLARQRWLDLSSASGYGVILYQVQVQDKISSYMSCVSSEDGYAGQDQLVLIDSLDCAQARLVDLTESLVLSNESMGLQVINAQMSPDGFYALLLVTDGEICQLMMMDMQTLALRNVATDLGIGFISGYDHALSANYAQGYAWVSSSNIIINTESGIRYMRIE